MSGVQYFRDQMKTGNRYVLFAQKDPNIPAWCAESQKLWDWGQKELLPWVAGDPTPETIKHARELLEDRYWLLYHRVEKEHRLDEAHADHPCLHRVWMELRIAVEDTKFTAPISKFLPPLRIVSTPEHPVIDAAPDGERTVAEDSGIIIGHDEDEAEHPDEDGPDE